MKTTTTRTELRNATRRLETAAFVIKAVCLGLTLLGVAAASVTCPWWTVATLGACLFVQTLNICN